MAIKDTKNNLNIENRLCLCAGAIHFVSINANHYNWHNALYIYGATHCAATIIDSSLYNRVMARFIQKRPQPMTPLNIEQHETMKLET